MLVFVVEFIVVMCCYCVEVEYLMVKVVGVVGVVFEDVGDVVIVVVVYGFECC